MERPSGEVGTVFEVDVGRVFLHVSLALISYCLFREQMILAMTGGVSWYSIDRESTIATK